MVWPTIFPLASNTVNGSIEPDTCRPRAAVDLLGDPIRRRDQRVPDVQRESPRPSRPLPAPRGALSTAARRRACGPTCGNGIGPGHFRQSAPHVNCGRSASNPESYRGQPGLLRRFRSSSQHDGNLAPFNLFRKLRRAIRRAASPWRPARPCLTSA